MIAIPIALGLLCAMLVNGLADNLAREEDVPFPAMFLPRCSYCDAQRKVRDWSAIFSNLFQSGRCLRCGAPRPFRDLLVEAILWVGLPAIWMTGTSDVLGLLIGGWILSAFLLFTVIDFEHRLVAVEAVALVSLILLLEGWILGTDNLIRMLEGGLVGFAVFLLFYFFGKFLAGLLNLGQGIEPLGFGDVILAALVGFVTGWPAILLAIFVSIILGGMAGLGLSVFSLLKKSPLQNATMAYGPYLLVAGLLVYFFGGQILGGVMNIFNVF